MIVNTGQISYSLKRGPSVFGVVGATGTPARGDLLRTSTERVCGVGVVQRQRRLYVPLGCSSACCTPPGVPLQRCVERLHQPALHRGWSLLPSRDVTLVISHSRAPSHSTRPFAEPCSPCVASADLQNTPVCTRLPSRPPAGLIARCQ